MRLKDSDLNVFMPKIQRDRILKEVNDALEKADRLDDQIRIWSTKDISDLHTKIMQDELQFLKEGKV